MTTTDAAGKWKRMESDAMGNLRYVYEPRPGGGADYVSEYVYSELGQLLTVTMSRPGKGTGNAATVTQARTWAYNGTTQRLDSVTHPESGTTSYLYNLDGSVQRKTDAKGQYVEYAYDTLTRPGTADDLKGWWFAVQIQVTLDGDLNSGNWKIAQSTSTSGTATAKGPKGDIVRVDPIAPRPLILPIRERWRGGLGRLTGSTLPERASILITGTYNSSKEEHTK